MEVLVCLAQNAGAPVSKEKLLQAVWPHTFVTEDVLTRSISELRRVFEDDVREPQIIETIPKRGYRLLPQVTLIQPPTASSAPSSAPAVARPRYSTYAAITAGVLLLLGGITLYSARSRIWPGPSSGRRVILAVLPFEDLNGDHEQEYFSDGLTEEIINRLGRLEPDQLRVIARTSVLGYKAGTRSIADIGRELGADYILEGTVRRESGRVRISAQLISVANQSQVWAATFERDLTGILIVQSEIADGVAEQVKIKFAPQQRVRKASVRPVNAEAYDLYLRGRFHWNRRSNEDVKKCIEYFEEGIVKDPNYALAYAALSEAYDVAAYRDLIPTQDGYRKSEAAALHALQLDDTLGEAHIALAGLYSDFEHWGKAIAEFERGLELDPNSVTGRTWYAEILSDLGRHREAVRETQLALKIDPLSLRANRDAGEKLYYAHRYDEAIAQYKKTLELYPEDFITYHDLFDVYLAKGMYEEAANSLFRCLELGATPGREKDQELLALRTTYRDGGIKDLLRLRAQLLEQKWRMHRWEVICDYARIGENDEAFTRIDKLFNKRLTNGRSVSPRDVTDPCLDNLRSDPRYRELPRRVNVPNDLPL